MKPGEEPYLAQELWAGHPCQGACRVREIQSFIKYVGKISGKFSLFCNVSEIGPFSLASKNSTSSFFILVPLFILWNIYRCKPKGVTELRCIKLADVLFLLCLAWWLDWWVVSELLGSCAVNIYGMTLNEICQGKRDTCQRNVK